MGYQVRKLTMDEADDLRRTHARTGASYEMLGHVFGISRSAAWDIVNGRSYLTPEQLYRWQEEPTPHDQITDAGWFFNMQPMPAPHTDIQRRYAAQNERDGYLSDPQYIAAVAEWRGDTAQLAAD